MSPAEKILRERIADLAAGRVMLWEVEHHAVQEWAEKTLKEADMSEEPSHTHEEKEHFTMPRSNFLRVELIEERNKELAELTKRMHALVDGTENHHKRIDSQEKRLDKLCAFLGLGFDDPSDFPIMRTDGYFHQNFERMAKIENAVERVDALEGWLERLEAGIQKEVTGFPFGGYKNPSPSPETSERGHAEHRTTDDEEWKPCLCGTRNDCTFFQYRWVKDPAPAAEAGEKGCGACSDRDPDPSVHPDWCSMSDDYKPPAPAASGERCVNPFHGKEVHLRRENCVPYPPTPPASPAPSEGRRWRRWTLHKDEYGVHVRCFTPKSCTTAESGYTDHIEVIEASVAEARIRELEERALRLEKLHGERIIAYSKLKQQAAKDRAAVESVKRLAEQFRAAYEVNPKPINDGLQVARYIERALAPSPEGE